MSVIYKSKSAVRIESSEAVQEFLARGGVIEVCKPKIRRKGATMAAKTSKSFKSASAPRGYTSSNFWG